MLDVLVFFVPEAHRDRVLNGLFEAGAGTIGDYDRCAFWSAGTGQFLPGRGANPTIGESGQVEMVAEYRVEVRYPRSLRDRIIAALKQHHPYEEPAYYTIEVTSE